LYLEIFLCLTFPRSSPTRTIDDAVPSDAMSKVKRGRRIKSPSAPGLCLFEHWNYCDHLDDCCKLVTSSQRDQRYLPIYFLYTIYFLLPHRVNTLHRQRKKKYTHEFM
jgi:hypothetical protein